MFSLKGYAIPPPHPQQTVNTLHPSKTQTIKPEFKHVMHPVLHFANLGMAGAAVYGPILVNFSTI